MHLPYFNKKIIAGGVGTLLIALLFVGASYISNTYGDKLEQLITVKTNTIGMTTYVGITAGAIVLAPISTLPLIPIAVSIWGWVVTGMLSIVGWLVGSQIAFLIARRYGKTFIQKFYSLEHLQKFENKFPQKNIFWTVVFLRMTIPVDVLSYGLGLFSRMSHKDFFLSTLIGVTPFAFLFSYVGSLPPGFQIISFIEILFLIFIIKFGLKYKENKQK